MHVVFNVCVEGMGQCSVVKKPCYGGMQLKDMLRKQSCVFSAPFWLKLFLIRFLAHHDVQQYADPFVMFGKGGRDGRRGDLAY